ncbi:hypothetical protein H4R34_005574 [Dimargaris verticillata]|uniref:Uncharacterized protein n=1 Tax=Dimargaris verticillata TaxID=2761393 RepID=A0A9W8AXY1_9FUNG|nr:hypothetical protein H4R34_005574 [Dimargaris verticillata]
MVDEVASHAPQELCAAFTALHTLLKLRGPRVAITPAVVPRAESLVESPHSAFLYAQVVE